MLKKKEKKLVILGVSKLLVVVQPLVFTDCHDRNGHRVAFDPIGTRVETGSQDGIP